MSIANPEAENLTMKQRIFIGVLGVLSVLLAALVVFYFSPAEETSEALPGLNLSPAVYELRLRTGDHYVQYTMLEVFICNCRNSARGYLPGRSRLFGSTRPGCQSAICKSAAGSRQERATGGP